MVPSYAMRARGRAASAGRITESSEVGAFEEEDDFPRNQAATATATTTGATTNRTRRDNAGQHSKRRSGLSPTPVTPRAPAPTALACGCERAPAPRSRRPFAGEPESGAAAPRRL